MVHRRFRPVEEHGVTEWALMDAQSIVDDSGQGRASPATAWAWRWAALTLVTLLGLHFGLIGLLIAAPAVVPGPLREASERYLAPWFGQDWRLFAPVPDVRDYAVYFRGEYRDGDGLRRTPWLTLLDPLVAATQANRLSTLGVRLEIAHKAALFSTREAGALALVPGGRALLAEHWATPERQPGAVIVLERLASAALTDLYPSRSFETVQVMVTGRLVTPVGGVSPDDSEAVFVLPPVPFQVVQR
jgi:hypothetical protein